MKKLLMIVLITITSFRISVAQLGNKNMYVLSNLNSHGTPYSAVWGYTAPDGREYAIMGCYDGTTFVDITDPMNIHQVGFVPSTNPGSSNNVWREMKTYSHYCYIVSEVSSSGIQIVDLQYLPDSIHYVKKFLPAGYSRAHSISQNGPYLYINGASIGQGVTVYDLTTNPETPVKRGANNTYYIHDCRVVNDTIYAANIYDGKVSIINAVNKNSLNTVLSFSNLPGSGPHNTALTPDRKYLLVTDEIGTAPFKLKFWDIQNLGNITYITSWQPTGITTSIVHNVEVYGKFALAAHYSAGIRMIDISNISSPTEVAWYDTYPANDNESYEGCWGAYMFPSGKIAVSDRATGLYVFRTYYKISAIIEGLYNSGTNKLNASDTARAYLRSTSSPYSIVDSSKAVLVDSTMSGNFRFDYALTGNYYISLKHRNSIETWSKAGGETYNTMTYQTYDFTNSISKAYGNNMIQVDVSPVEFAVFSGDVNQDGNIDVKDLVDIYSDIINYQTGYVRSDLDGNLTTDISDLLICYNNSIVAVSKITP